MKRKKLRVVVLMHPSTVPPDDPKNYSEREAYEWKTELDVMTTLGKLGHEVNGVAVRDELSPIRDVIEQWKPDIVFNLLEEFLGQQEFDHHVVSYLEMMQVDGGGDGLNLARRMAMEINWQKDVDQALAKAKSSKKPVLLDFSAAPM